MNMLTDKSYGHFIIVISSAFRLYKITQKNSKTKIALYIIKVKLLRRNVIKSTFTHYLIH